MNNIFSKITKQQQSIGNLIVFTVVTLLLRALLTQSLFFGFLLWNMFLAVIPYLISEFVKTKSLTKTKLLIYAGLWLLFLPNAPYMITDFIHLHHLKSTLVWYDLFMLFCFAFTGLLIAIISINDFYNIILNNYTQKIGNNFIALVSLLCGFGIYLGRFLRLNSWEIFTNPFNIFQQIINAITLQETWFITIGFGSLIAIIFSVYKNNTTLPVIPEQNKI